VKGGAVIGPFGAAEKPSGEMRDLTEAEAEEIGLTRDDFRQTYLARLFEARLNRELAK
jgi:hypothetical protein